MSPDTCDLLLGVTVKRSFERISVDGQLSTSDTVILQASGASGVRIEPETDDELRFGEALDALMRQLALLVVRDGEGARRVGRVVVRGGSQEVVERVARAIANSPLVKTALYGGDPNWGRIAQAVGMATAGPRAGAARHRDRGRARLRAAARSRRTTPTRWPRPCSATRSSTRSACPATGAETEVFFSDLGHEYVTINADYTT